MRHRSGDRPRRTPSSPSPRAWLRGRLADRAFLSRPALPLYLAAVALLPWHSFPPFPWLHANAQWSDPFVGAAAVARVLERRQDLRLARPSPVVAALALYVVAATLSFLSAGGGARGLAATLELAVIALLTADFASERHALRTMVRVVAVTSLLTAVAAIAGLVLFYLGVETSLVGTYGALVPSADYARVQAGLAHPALLGSFCIFASAVVALGEGALPRRLRVATQLALALTVVLTFSRAVLGFALTALVRAARTRRHRAAAVAIAVVSLGLIGTLTFANLRLDPTSPLDTRIETQPEPDRRKELKSSIDSLLDHPIFGTGPGSLPGTSSLGQRQAHNTPVGVAATLGLPALLALVALAVALWRTRSRPTDRATWGGLAGLGVDGLGQDVEHFRHLWVMIGLAGARPRGRTSRRDEPPDGGRRRQ